MTIFEYKKSAVQKLQNSSPSAALDVEVFLQFFTGFSKTQLLLKRDTEISDEQISLLDESVKKRISGLPVAYITGVKEFYGYNFAVTPAVLIPKPDTEVLVEMAVDFIVKKMEAHPNEVLSVCDMCTGSGCIAISVLKTLIDVYKIPYGSLPKFTLVDISKDALEIARKNADLLLEVEYRNLLRFTQSNLFEMVPWSFDVILTNPPYIPASMVDELLKDGRSEPRLALDGDVNINGERTLQNDGLGIIRNLLPDAVEHMNPFAIMIMETGEYNAKEAAELAEELDLHTELYKDLEGQLRGFTASL